LIEKLLPALALAALALAGAARAAEPDNDLDRIPSGRNR